MSKAYFYKDLERGKRGEKLLLNRYPYLIEDSTDGHDMIDTRGESPITIEVKTDSYLMSTTPNFFMELYSDNKSFKKGGPWRSADHGTDIFLYQFKHDFKIFWFDNIPLLVTELESYIREKNLQYTSVENAGYDTLGYKIPRHILAEFYTELDFGDPLPTKQKKLVTGK